MRARNQTSTDSPSQHENGNNSPETRARAEEAHLNFRLLERCWVFKPCTTPCNPIQGSMGGRTPCQPVAKVDYSTIMQTHTYTDFPTNSLSCVRCFASIHVLFTAWSPWLTLISCDTLCGLFLFIKSDCIENCCSKK